MSRSLVSHLVGRVVFFLILLSCVFALAWAFTTYSDLNKQRIEKESYFLDHLSYISNNFYVVGDIYSLKSKFKQIISEDENGIERVVFVNTSGEIIISYPEEISSSDLLSKDNYKTFGEDIYYRKIGDKDCFKKILRFGNKESYGILLVLFKPRPVLSVVWKRITFIFFITVVLILLSSKITKKNIQAILSPVVEYIDKLSARIKSGSYHSGVESGKKILFEEEMALKNSFDILFENILKYKQEIEKSSHLAAIGQTTAMIAHDIRKPFAQIKTLLDLLPTRKDDTFFLESSMASVEGSLKRADSMIHDILDYSRETEIKQERYNPQAFIASAIGEVFQTRNAKDISIDYDLRHKNYLYVDRDKMFRAFTNIIDNALDAMSGVGKMWISTCDIDCFVRIVIGNNGPMISKELLPKIFDAFFTSQKNKGTGLGLAISNKVISAHGGKIWVESLEGSTEFFIDVPSSVGSLSVNEAELIRHSSEVVTAPKEVKKGPITILKESIESVRQKVSKKGEKLRFLIMDDEKLFRESIICMLKKNFDVSQKLDIVEASTIGEAQKLIDEEIIDFAVCDIDMGDKEIDGYDIAQGLLKKHKNINLVIHSNKRRAGDDERIRNIQGMNGFIAKPMREEDLLIFLANGNFGSKSSQ